MRAVYVWLLYTHLGYVSCDIHAGSVHGTHIEHSILRAHILPMERLLLDTLVPSALKGVANIDYHKKITHYSNIQSTAAMYNSMAVYNVTCDSQCDKWDDDNKQTTTKCTNVWLASIPRVDTDGLYTIRGKRYCVSMRQRLVSNVPICYLKEGLLRCQIRSEHYETMESTLVTMQRNTRGTRHLTIVSSAHDAQRCDVMSCFKTMLPSKDWRHNMLRMLSAMGASGTVLASAQISAAAMADTAVTVPKLPQVAGYHINAWGIDVPAEYVIICQMLLKFLRVECGEQPIDDRDDYVYKGIELHMVLMAKLLRRLAVAAGPSISSNARADKPIIHEKLVEAITHNRWEVLGNYGSDVKLSRLVDCEGPMNIQESLREVVTVTGTHGVDEYMSDEFNHRMVHPSQLGCMCIVRTGNDKDAGIKSYLADDCTVSTQYTLGASTADEMILLKQAYSAAHGPPSPTQKLSVWTHNHVPMLTAPAMPVMSLLDNMKKVYPQLGWSVVDGVIESRTYYGRLLCSVSGIMVDNREVHRLRDVMRGACRYSKLCYEVPFMNMMPVPRTTLSTKIIQKSIAYLGHKDPLLEYSTLCHSQRPLVTTTKANKELYGYNVVVAYITLEGYGIQDGIVVNKSSVERGLFSTVHNVCKRWERSDAHVVSSYMVYVSRYSPVKEGTALATIDYVDDVGTTHNVTMKHDKPHECTVSDVILEFEEHTNPMAKHLIGVRVMLQRRKVLGVGDKLSSRMGQKAVAVCVYPAENMPTCLDDRLGSIDIIINPLSMISRCTMSQEASSALGIRVAATGTIYTHEPFEKPTYAVHHVDVMEGTTGIIRQAQVQVGVEYYMVLRHIADNKVRCRGAASRDSMTGGISGEACVRFNWQEMAAMLHGNSRKLASHVYSTDMGYYPHCPTCNRDTDGNICPVCKCPVEERVHVSRSLMTLKKVMSVLGVAMRVECDV